MIIDSKQYSGPCACGARHAIVTALAVIEAGCLTGFDTYASELGLGGRRAAIYDENTYAAEGLVRPAAAQEIILPADGLLANERAVSLVLQSLQADIEVLVAVGGGTVHDIVRYCAHKLGLPFISCPTAASVDGYASNVCTMVWRGVQEKMPGTAPRLVLADVDVLAKAPPRLARAGIGEALGKFAALTDWRVADLLTDEKACPAAEAMMLQAAVVAQGCCEGLSRNDEGAVAQLMYALLLSGFALQMMGESRPVSTAEHHLTYLMELLPGELGVTQTLLHGEKVGVSALLAAALYRRVAEIDDIAPYVKAYQPMDRAWLVRRFGESVGATLLTENTPDVLARITPQKLTDRWEAVRRAVWEMPDADALADALSLAGGKASLVDLGIAEDMAPRMLELAPCVRNRLTLLRLLRMLKFRHANDANVPRSPSRGKRYVEKPLARAGGAGTAFA